MPRDPRYLPPGATVEVVCKTLHSTFLLRPCKEVNRIILGVLARAAERYDVAVHFFVFMSNHYHLHLTPKDQKQLSGFMRYLNSNTARKIGRLYNWKERFWGRRYQATPFADSESEHHRLVYLLEHGCKEGLVASPVQWPGVSPLNTLLAGYDTMEGEWTDLTAMYEARKALPAGASNHRSAKLKERDFRSLHTLHLTPYPSWEEDDRKTIASRLLDLVADIVERTRKRHEEENTKPLGVKAILQQSERQTPTSIERSPAPRVHARSREARQRFFEALDAFLENYRAAAEKLREGIRDVAFPPGCFPPALPFVELASST